MNKIFLSFFLFLFLLIPCFSFAQYSPVAANENIFYYSVTCPHCKKVEEFFSQYGVVEKYKIISKEVSGNPQNAKELFDLSVANNIPVDEIGVPVLYFQSQFISGDEDIINFFKAKLGLDTVTSTSQSSSTQGNTMPVNNPDQKSNLTITTVIIAALADSINPCAFSVMVFLLLSLTAIGARKRMLKVGIAYIVSVYVVYLLAGLGLLATIQAIGSISKIILYVAAALAIFAGLVNIKDFFFYGKGFTLAIPESRKPIMEKYIKQASLPGAIILGILVSMFELPCTGGFYLAILALLAHQTTYATGLMYLIFYNIIFVLPLAIILAVVYYGIKPEKLEQWRTAKRKWMRLVMGIVLVALGIALVFLF